MTNGILSGDSALPTSSTGPKSASALLGDDATEGQTEGEVNVLERPESSLEAASSTQLSCLLQSHSTAQQASGERPPANPTCNSFISTSNLQRRMRRRENSEKRTDLHSGNIGKSNKKLDATGRTHLRHSRRYRVQVRTSLGTKYEVKLRATDSVMRAKEKIGMITNVFSQSMHLFFNGVQLADDHATMGKLGISEGKTLDLILHLQSGPLEVEGSQLNDETLCEKILSHLSEQQSEELDPCSTNSSVSFVAAFDGMRVLVQLKPIGEGSMVPTSLGPESGNGIETEIWGRKTTNHGGFRKDAQWRRERQIEHKNMRCCMEGVREKLRQAKAAKLGKFAIPHAGENSNQIPSKVIYENLRTKFSSSDNLPAIAATTKCQTCSVRLGLIVFPCKCGFNYCPSHRHDHCCTFDYRAA